MAEKQKLKEILELEKVYGIELEQIINNNVERNYFKLDENGNVIDISLAGNKIEKIKVLISLNIFNFLI